MKKAPKIIGGILFSLIVLVAIVWFGFLRPEPPPISPEDRSEITLMPLPVLLKLGSGVLVLDGLPNHQFTGPSTPRLDRAIERFYGWLSLQTGMIPATSGEVDFMVDFRGGPMDYPAYGDDESYILKITGNKIFLAAETETGIIYGLESLLQLVREQDDQWVLPELKMFDRPRYGWRGLMIDACRHWIPKEVILRNLDAMATVKMNVLHWHLTEYQGFRVESKVFPKLHEMGSNGDYYTQDDIREVVEYAADRCIRVVPEFDLPGHSTSWFVGHPELASVPGPYVLDTTFMVLDPVMDPTREEVYDFLDQFFEEMTGLFPDKYLHIGGDEVSPTHWLGNPLITGFMKEHGLEDHHELQAYFNVRMQKLLDKHGKTMMGWDEIIHPDLPVDGIAVQTWRDHASLWESARNGNQAVLSAGYYLDYKQPASYHYNVDPAIISGAVDIEIDSTNWSSWDFTLDLSDMVMEGSLYLFGQGDSLRGIMNFGDMAAGFTDVTANDEQISYMIETNFGNVKFDLSLDGDSIKGKAKVAIVSLDIRGNRLGGSDIPGGVPLPEIKKIEPLTPEQESLIMGGEACMWSEMVDGVTQESRVWPRAAAIGEKLWSPAVLTGDTRDMYRRLWMMDDRLEELGLKHRKHTEILLANLTGDADCENLHSFIGALQEDRFFNRMVIYDPVLYTTTPLNRVVDASPAESRAACEFSWDVDLWIETGDMVVLERVKATLEAWSSMEQSVAPCVEASGVLKEVSPHLENLSRLAETCLEVLSQPDYYNIHAPTIENLLAEASEAHGGTVLAIVEPVQKLMEAAREN